MLILIYFDLFEISEVVSLSLNQGLTAEPVVS